MAVTSRSSRYDALRVGDSHTVLSKNIILSRLVSGWLMANVGCSAYQPLLPFSQARQVRALNSSSRRTVAGETIPRTSWRPVTSGLAGWEHSLGTC